MTEHLTIGAFARRTGLSLKALRLYDRSGLLIPDEVDADTGYRYYSPTQELLALGDEAAAADALLAW